MARIRHAARPLVGPLALAGFFLPLASGPGVLSGEEYSGFQLVGMTGRLQSLDLGVESAAALWGLRTLLVGVAIAACWQTVLAPTASWHRGYAVSGWYLVGTAVAGLTVGAMRSDLQMPPVGLSLCAAGAALFMACEAARLPWRGLRVRRRPRASARHTDSQGPSTAEWS